MGDNIHAKTNTLLLFFYSPPDLVDLKIAHCKYGSGEVLKDAGHLFPMDSPAVTGKKKSELKESKQLPYWLTLYRYVLLDHSLAKCISTFLEHFAHSQQDLTRTQQRGSKL